MEKEIKGDGEGHNPLSGIFYFKFKMDGQDVILDIQWLEKLFR